MAVVIESVTSQSSGALVTDVGPSGTFLVTKPTGLTVGDVLFVATSVDAGTCSPPAGWSTGTLLNDFGSFTDYFYKVADAGDVSASNYTFTTTSDSAEYMYVCYRLSGTATSIDPVIVKRDGDSDSSGSSSSDTFTSVTVPAGSVAIIFIGIDSQTTTGSTGTLSNYALNGGSLTFTERFEDNDVGGSEDGAAIADAPVVSDTTFTGVSFDNDDAKSPATLYKINVLFIYPKQDASTTLTLTETSNTAFAPAGQAGVTTTLTLTETEQTAFAPTAEVVNTTNWQNEAEPSTTWTNETI